MPPNYTVDPDHSLGQATVSIGPVNVAECRVGIIGGAVLIEMRDLMRGAGTTGVAIPFGLSWQLGADIDDINPDLPYTVPQCCDPNGTAQAPWATLDAIAAALQV